MGCISIEEGVFADCVVYGYLGLGAFFRPVVSFVRVNGPEEPPPEAMCRGFVSCNSGEGAPVL